MPAGPGRRRPVACWWPARLPKCCHIAHAAEPVAERWDQACTHVPAAAALARLGGGSRWRGGKVRLKFLFLRIPDPLRLLDTTGAASRQRPVAQTALDALARAALCAGGEVVPAKANRRRQVSGGVRRHRAGAAGPVGVRQDQYGVCGSATRWSKGSHGFRVDREVKRNSLTS
jgi:hypothetical protein